MSDLPYICDKHCICYGRFFAVNKSSGIRKCVFLMTRLRSGFIGLNPYHFMIGLSTSPDCLYCPSTKEIIQHYLLQCPIHGLPRDKLFRILNSIGLNNGIIKVSVLLSGSHFSPGIRKKVFLLLHDYFKDIDKIDLL